MNIYQQRRSGTNNVRPNDHRDPYQRDRARILHSSAFRRLQAKTQILGVGHDDFYRTRLTHSLEVAQIGTGILAHLKQHPEVLQSPKLNQILPSDALIESLCLGHDIGHPPFGHGGEVALNYKMWKAGGFEANGHALRIIAKLEPYTKDFGMDLTRRTTLGLIKYPQFIRSNLNFEDTQSTPFIEQSKWKPVKGLFGIDKPIINWALDGFSTSDIELFTTQDIETQDTGSKVLTTPYQQTSSVYKTLDASIMEMADDIAYAVHDLEDAIALNIVTKDMWFHDVLPAFKALDNPWARKHSEQLSNMLFSDELFERKNAIGALVNHLITNTETFQVNEQFAEPLFAFNIRLTATSAPILKLLKGFVFNRVIQSFEIQQAEFKGQQILANLFDAVYSEPIRLTPKHISQHLKPDSDETAIKRFVCDYLANMSDNQALRSYNQLFGTSDL